MQATSVLAALAAAAVLAGCGPDNVPEVADPHNIVVDGQAMKGQDFLERYCADKAEHATCIKVRRAVVADATRSKAGAPRF